MKISVCAGVFPVHSARCASRLRKPRSMLMPWSPSPIARSSSVSSSACERTVSAMTSMRRVWRLVSIVALMRFAWDGRFHPDTASVSSFPGVSKRLPPPFAGEGQLGGDEKLSVASLDARSLRIEEERPHELDVDRLAGREVRIESAQRHEVVAIDADMKVCLVAEILDAR